MSADFIPLLREAHAVCMAHSLGLRNVGEIASYCHLSVAKVSSWLHALDLPYNPPETSFTTVYTTLTNQPLRKLP